MGPDCSEIGLSVPSFGVGFNIPKLWHRVHQTKYIFEFPPPRSLNVSLNAQSGNDEKAQNAVLNMIVRLGDYFQKCVVVKKLGSKEEISECTLP